VTVVVIDQENGIRLSMSSECAGTEGSEPTPGDSSPSRRAQEVILKVSGLLGP